MTVPRANISDWMAILFISLFSSSFPFSLSSEEQRSLPEPNPLILIPRFLASNMLSVTMFPCMIPFLWMCARPRVTCCDQLSKPWVVENIFGEYV